MIAFVFRDKDSLKQHCGAVGASPADEARARVHAKLGCVYPTAQTVLRHRGAVRHCLIGVADRAAAWCLFRAWTA